MKISPIDGTYLLDMINIDMVKMFIPEKISRIRFVHNQLCRKGEEVMTTNLVK